MSSTGRVDRPRSPLDDYPTPRWCVHRLLEAIGDELPGGIWSEPCAGAGSIIRAVDGVRSDVRWFANEINADYGEVLTGIPSVLGVTHHDARALELPATVSVAITNPPFEGSEDVLVSLLAPGSLTAIVLQRLNWCGGPRAELFRQLRPSVFILPNRPSFRESERVDPKTGKTKKSTTDSIEYAWFVFDGLGRFRVLADTPKDVRAAEKAERRSGIYSEGSTSSSRRATPRRSPRRRAMLVMVANRSGVEVGYMAGRYPGTLGHLYSPGAERGPWPFLPYALDNGAWGAHLHGTPWDESEWKRLVSWAAKANQAPLWCLVPDVVADREATIASWHKYVGEVRRHGFRPAFALQDGMTFADVPSDDCVLFLGGSTEWKVAAIKPWCARFPSRVHVGRVNTRGRLWACYEAGAISVDGTGWFTKKGGQAADLNLFIEHVSTHGGCDALSGL